MSHINRIAQGVNVAPMLWALQQHPELWNRHADRTRDPKSPHHGISDIWARYAEEAIEDKSQPHDAVWYPAAEVLPVRELVMPLFSAVKGTKLGGILITHIPPGRAVQPHVDNGWHAKHYEKFAIQIQSAPGQKFCFEGGDELEAMPGDVYTFDNSVSHWVKNDTVYDRITLIACIRKD